MTWLLRFATYSIVLFAHCATLSVAGAADPADVWDLLRAIEHAVDRWNGAAVGR